MGETFLTFRLLDHHVPIQSSTLGGYVCVRECLDEEFDHLHDGAIF